MLKKKQPTVVKIPLKEYERCIDDNIGVIGILEELLVEIPMAKLKMTIKQAIELMQDENFHLKRYDPLKYTDKAKNIKQLTNTKYQTSLF